MSATKLSRVHAHARACAGGSTLIEFALIVLVFLMFLFAVLELARLMFLYNTFQEVTRRAASAAATTDFSKSTEMDKVRQDAIFRSTSGSLVLMPELTDQAVRVDYMSLSMGADGALAMQAIAAGAVPSSPEENRRNCLIDPYADNCIRLVRVRICDPATTSACSPMMFNTWTSIVSLTVAMPLATTIASAQTLGLR
ncbi:TadE family protein [Massilia sp. PWRC2]|uniref:TadE family protein n=1 Tax=Massilia sp. PWRC2 TaxID=2804626 RepID=UPI003CE6A251